MNYKYTKSIPAPFAPADLSTAKIASVPTPAAPKQASCRQPQKTSAPSPKEAPIIQAMSKKPANASPAKKSGGLPPEALFLCMFLQDFPMFGGNNRPESEISNPEI